jgi:hypothetical protein
MDVTGRIDARMQLLDGGGQFLLGPAPACQFCARPGQAGIAAICHAGLRDTT